MQVYRLVDKKHDPIEVGKTLERCSDHSNQKLGEGIYFAPSRESALEFAKTKHHHTYAHLLTCRLEGITEMDFVDLSKDPHVIDNSEFGSLTHKMRNQKYCEKYSKKGIIWKAVSGWVEVCLFAEHVSHRVIIEAVEVLTIDEKPNSI
jgi:hypothetical protein